MCWSTTRNQVTIALLLVLTVLLIAAMFVVGDGPDSFRRRREKYLIYPYLDLDAPGERGSFYAMMECA